MLTTAQLATLKTAIPANSANYTNAGAIAQRDGENIAAWFNKASGTAVWGTAIDVQSVYDAIDWTKYTPTDTPDNTATFTNRALVIQTKQMNLQNMLQGRTTINGAKANVRAGLRDAVILLPSGTAGAAISAGGASGITVMTALTRFGTNGEVLFITSSPALGGVTAGIMGFEGSLSGSDVLQAMDS